MKTIQYKGALYKLSALNIDSLSKNVKVFLKKTPKGGWMKSGVIYVQTNPPKKLLELCMSGSGGGNGEFEQFLPKPCRKETEEHDATWTPIYDDSESYVIWERIR